MHIKNLHKALRLLENEEIVMLLDLGFATEDTKPMTNLHTRKPITETTSRI